MSATWVLLRGLARDSRHWEGFPSQLRAALPEGSRIVLLDLPGNGSLHRERSPLTVAGMVLAYRRGLHALGVGGPAHLLGLSLGAMAAVEWAARHPQEIASAVLANGSFGGQNAIHERLRPAAAWQLMLAALARDEPDRERRIVRLCTNAADVDSVALRWTAHARQARTGAANALRQLAAAARWRLPAAKPRVPMLVVAGTRDRLASPECSIALARAWHLPVALHPGAGHELAIDDGPWLARQCGRWAASLHA